MKIVYCIASLHNPGGMESVLTAKANYLASLPDYELHIVTREGADQPFFPLSEKISLHELHTTNKHDYRRALEKKLFEIRPDITISLFGDERSFLYRIKDGSRKIIEFHYSRNYLIHLVQGIAKMKFRRLHLLKAYLRRIQDRFYIGRYDQAVLLTHRDYELWGAGKNMCWIPNPLTFHTERCADTSVRKIIAVGRYTPQKGFDLLIEAFSRTVEEFPDWELSIFGDGAERNRLQKMIDTKNLTERVHLEYPSHQITDEMLRGSLFAFPSRYEGFGLVLLEAMQCGLPSVAFDCECGPSEIIQEGLTGYLVTPGDTEAFARAMKKLMADPEERKHMGLAAKAASENFRIEKIMQNWIKLFGEIATPKSQHLELGK